MPAMKSGPEEKMKKIISLIVICIFMTSAFAIAEQGLEKQKNIPPRLAVCVSFLKEQDVENPYDRCMEIANKEKDCVDYLKELGIDNPLNKCDRLFIAAKNIRTVKNNVTATRLQAALKNVDSAKSEFLKKLTDERVKVFLKLPRAKQKEILKNEAEDKLDKYKIVKYTQDLYKKRKLASEVLKRWEQQYQGAKKRFLVAQKWQQQKHKAFVDAKKNQIEACKNPGSDECKAAEESAIDMAKAFLDNSVDIAIEHVNQIVSKVEGSEDMDEDRAKEILDELEGILQELEDLKDRVDNAETKDEIKDAARTLEKIWLRSRHRVQLYAAHVLNARVSLIIKQSERLEDRLDCAASELDDAEIDDKIDEFSELVQDAKNDYENARELYRTLREMKKGSEMGEKNQELTRYVQSAHDKLKTANRLLNDIFKELRAKGVNPTDCKDDDVVVEDCTEDYDHCIDDCAAENDQCEADYTNEESESCDDLHDSCVDACEEC